MKIHPDLRTFGPEATALAFPLGGIGTGNVSLGARGDFRDWEIFNRPAKNTVLPNTFFTLRAQAEGSLPVLRVLEGRIQPPYHESHGFDPSTGAGLPRFSRCRFYGQYPLARLDLSDDAVPVDVTLEAYTPLIPLNPEDSGLPCAVLTYTLTNTAALPVQVTLVGSMMNPVGHHLFNPLNDKRDQPLGQTVNAYRESDALRGLHFSAAGIDASALEYGTLSLVTDHPQVTVKRHWLRGMWWDFLRDFWDDLEADGHLTDFGYTALADYPDTASLGVVDTLAPGEQKAYRFVLAWYFPNRINHWDFKPERVTRNYYAVRFADSWDVAAYTLRELPRLSGATQAFHDALFGSTYPPEVLDAVSANIVPVRSTTCFWLADGRFYGWEGCFDNAGCCAGSCTHVWSYAYTAAHLFPSLERAMRDIELNVETDTDGYMSFRTFGTFEDTWSWRGEKIAAVDGQMGSVLRTYREFLLSGDREWLARMWEGVKRAMRYAGVNWDRDGDHMLEDRQHNTYDIEFYGPNPLCSIYYLAALKATAAMARVMDDNILADRLETAFTQGSARLDTLLWNGEYFQQRIDDIDAHPYQHGAGILSDQLLGQLHARLLGLGDVLPREHVRAAVKAIFDHNFRRSFLNHVNVQRTFVLNDEAGLILCSWPRGGRPRFPFVYSDEVWTGVEYHVAAHLITEGWHDQALEMVRAVRRRHDGVRRSPWNEVECGHHYARSMSSWMLLLALSGVQADMARAELSFAPVVDVSTGSDVVRTFWSTARAWGVYTQRRDPSSGVWQPEITVLGGDASGLRVTACGQTLTL